MTAHAPPPRTVLDATRAASSLCQCRHAASQHVSRFGSCNHARCPCSRWTWADASDPHVAAIDALEAALRELRRLRVRDSDRTVYNAHRYRSLTAMLRERVQQVRRAQAC